MEQASLQLQIVAPRVDRDMSFSAVCEWRQRYGPKTDVRQG